MPEDESAEHEAMISELRAIFHVMDRHKEELEGQPPSLWSQSLKDTVARAEQLLRGLSAEDAEDLY